MHRAGRNTIAAQEACGRCVPRDYEAAPVGRRARAWVRRTSSLHLHWRFRDVGNGLPSMGRNKCTPAGSWPLWSVVLTEMKKAAKAKRVAIVQYLQEDANLPGRKLESVRTYGRALKTPSAEQDSKAEL